jgi:glycine/D-amino acid oxidase-like deaminating enzyme
MLFGGRCTWGSEESDVEDEKLGDAMLSRFAQLKDTKIAHCWHGPLELTLNRLPHVGRLASNVYFAHGFSGHGIAASNIAGTILAEAISGQAGRFDVFARVGHMPIPFGKAGKHALFSLGILWNRIRDAI